MSGAAERRRGRALPRRDDPDFGEELVLAVVAVVFGEHFAQLVWELVGLARSVLVMLTGLVVADAESRAAAIAELERFDRVGRIFRDFFVENRHWAVQIGRQVILRGGSRILWLNYGSPWAALYGAEPEPGVADC
jgi:hypothetical protein